MILGEVAHRGNVRVERLVRPLVSGERVMHLLSVCGNEIRGRLLRGFTCLAYCGCQRLLRKRFEQEYYARWRLRLFLAEE